VAKGTQPDIVAKLEQAMGRAMADPSLQKKMAGTPFIVNFVPGREFGAEMSAEFDKFSRLISTLNLKGQ
jgi:tripartite-type tricarboxylate transporter receptor subunit TctC